MSYFTLPADSRIWIYQASRFLTLEEENYIISNATAFFKEWNSHGIGLVSEFIVLDKLFIIIAADKSKANASGCSIDQSVRLIKTFEKNLNINLTGRTTIAFQRNNSIELMEFQEFRKKIDSGEISQDTLIYNNLISTISDFNNARLVAAKNSWLMEIPV